MAAAVCPPGLPWGAKYYTDVGGVCTRDTSFFGGKPVLNQGVGYAVVLGFGAIFAVATSFLVRLRPKTLELVLQKNCETWLTTTLFCVSQTEKDLRKLGKEIEQGTKKIAADKFRLSPFSSEAFGRNS
jgi:hypothetical protein